MKDDSYYVVMSDEYDVDMFLDSINLINKLQDVLGKPDEIKIHINNVSVKWEGKFCFHVTSGRVSIDNAYFGGIYSLLSEISKDESSKIKLLHDNGLFRGMCYVEN